MEYICKTNYKNKINKVEDHDNCESDVEKMYRYNLQKYYRYPYFRTFRTFVPKINV